MRVGVERVIEAAAAIPRPFVRAPQFRSEGLSRLLDVEVILKVETINPVGSSMGRSAEWWFECHPEAHRVISASAGDFGTAVGRAGAARGVDVVVFGPLGADPAKVDALRRSGTVVRLYGDDADDARAEAHRYASMVDAVVVEDGVEVELVEGAATMAAELEHLSIEPETLFVPIGAGTLALATGSWCHERLPRTRVVGVAAEAAPAMARSIRERRSVSSPSPATAAHELSIRTPNEKVIAPLADALDETRSVTDHHMRQAAEALAVHEGLLVSLSGAAALAAAALAAPALRGSTVVVPVTSRQLR